MSQTPQLLLDSATLFQCAFCQGLGLNGISRDDGSSLSNLVIVDLRLVRSRSSDGCVGCSIIEKALAHLSPEWRNFTNRSKCEKCRPKAFRLCRTGDCAKSAFALLPLVETIELCYPFHILDDLAAGPERNLELFIKKGNGFECLEKGMSPLTKMS